MPVHEGEDGKLYYTDGRRYESYGEWYDEGPGSEKFKRELKKSLKYSDFIKQWEDKKKEPTEYITDGDLEIDV